MNKELIVLGIESSCDETSAGSLLVGSSFAKSLSLALNKPLVSVNHMQAHILAHFIEHEDQKKPEFPFLCLTVSGGHTQIVKVKNYNEMEIIGTTLDDAAGEAFDKSAKVLGLKYPGGPLIDKYAKNGDINAFVFGKPKIDKLNFSFSGLKTSIMNNINNSVQKDKNFIKNNLNDLCASIQESIVSILIDKNNRYKTKQKYYIWIILTTFSSSIKVFS